MKQIPFHHYPQSPVAEKVRVVLGIKSLDWYSVEIPRLPPKPDLMPLTGGYRRTPVMQIGADIYCDSQCIIQELENRFPVPSVHGREYEGSQAGGQAGLEWGISRWMAGPMFTHGITVVLGAAESLPAGFAEDRGRLYFGPSFDLTQVQTEVAHSVAQLNGQFAWFEETLSRGQSFIMGNNPGLIDALAYHLVWFLRGRWSDGPLFFARFPALCEWEKRVREIGHGRSTEIDSAEALTIAANAVPQTQEGVGPTESLSPADLVDVQPEGDGGDPIVRGAVVVLNRSRIAIARTDERVGDVVVHFPRIGYRVTAV